MLRRVPVRPAWIAELESDPVHPVRVKVDAAQEHGRDGPAADGFSRDAGMGSRRSGHRQRGYEDEC